MCPSYQIGLDWLLFSLFFVFSFCRAVEHAIAICMHGHTRAHVYTCTMAIVLRVPVYTCIMYYTYSSIGTRVPVVHVYVLEYYTCTPRLWVHVYYTYCTIYWIPVAAIVRCYGIAAIIVRVLHEIYPIVAARFLKWLCNATGILNNIIPVGLHGPGSRSACAWKPAW